MKKKVLGLTVFMFLMLLLGTLYGVPLNGKWTSTSKNTVYLYDENDGLRIQVVTATGLTYTWKGIWLEKNKSFWYETEVGRYKGNIESANTIIVSGMTDVIVKESGKERKEKIKQVFIWRRVKPYKEAKAPKKTVKKQNKKSPRRSQRIKRSKYRNNYYQQPYYYRYKPPTPAPVLSFKPEPTYDYVYASIGWECKKGGKYTYQTSISKNKSSVAYGGVDANGHWLALIIPVISLEHETWGISVIFSRTNGKWVLRYMRPMRIVRKANGNISWHDLVNYSIPIRPDDYWQLKTKNSNQFYFEFQGSIYLGPNKWVKKIKMKGFYRVITE